MAGDHDVNVDLCAPPGIRVQSSIHHRELTSHAGGSAESSIDSCVIPANVEVNGPFIDQISRTPQQELVIQAGSSAESTSTSSKHHETTVPPQTASLDTGLSIKQGALRNPHRVLTPLPRVRVSLN